MKRRLAVFLCVVSLAGGSLVAATSGKIAGAVRDKSTQQALPGVNITIEGTRLGAATDANGEYFILSVPPGTYGVTASLMGYGKLTQTGVRVHIDQTSRLDFLLTEEAIQVREITITAERPKIELDLTASKESMSHGQIENSWGTEIREVVSDIPAANINGGIRGSFGLDVSYRMDGIDLRDIGSNTNFSSVNISTIQELEVLTGGWNAEFGQANGSIINIVTRRAEDRVHGIITYRMRPPGRYHWGRAFYGDEDIFSTLMTTPEFWDPTKTWKTPWMEKEGIGYSGGDTFFRNMSPEQRAEWWKNFVNDRDQFPQIDYTERMQWEQEVTLYGPLVPGVGFLISGRYKEGVAIYPSALKYNPDMTFQGALDWSVQKATKVGVTAMFTKFVNSGPPRTNYQSSEESGPDVVDQELAYLTDPYSRFKYWMYGTKGNSDEFTVRPPEKAQLLNIQAKLTHMFGSSTFLEVALQHSQMQYRLDYRDIARSANFPAYGLPVTEFPDTVNDLPGYGRKPPVSFWDARWGMAGDIWRSWADSRSYTLKADLTSQITKQHLVKAGFVFSLQHFQKMVHEGSLVGEPYAQVNDIVPIKDNPYEGSLYVQDKMEVGNMVVNAGVRFDFFNANKNVSSNIYDPLMLSPLTPGNPGQIGRVGYRPDGDGPGYVKTPTRYAISPRLGISHPITETTVLHFMFGVFNQRPAWNKLLASPEVWTNKVPQTMDSDFFLPDTTIVLYRFYGPRFGNPALTWERMTQYEIGFEQNIADVLSLDVTMYYKDAHDLTSLGIQQGPGSTVIQESGASVEVRLHGDPYDPNAQTLGRNIRNLYTTVNGAWADVRGIEVKLGSRLRWINFDFAYTLSYLSTGSYHLDRMYKSFDGTKLGEDRYNGASNADNGGVGLDDASWNPHNAAMLKLNINSPEDFGPQLLGFYPLGDWTLTSSTRWVEGDEYTYYPSDYTGVQTPNNRRWEDRWNTNLSLSRSIRLLGDFRLKLFVQVTNLFDQKHLRMLSGDSRRRFIEEGILPFNSATGEPMVWSWYSNLPRQVMIGTTIEL